MEPVKIITLTLAELQATMECVAEDAACRAIEKMRAEEHEDPEELLSVVDIAKEFKYNTKTLFARIKERHIQTLPFPENRRQLAIRRKHLNEVLKKAS